MRRALVIVIRCLRRLWGFLIEVAGIVGCLVLIMFFLPLVPVFKAFEDICSNQDDE